MRGSGYEIAVVVGGQPVDADCDALDVVVTFDSGAHHAAVFGTLNFIRERLDHCRESGECASGLYFWTSDLIIVERVNLEVIRDTVADLMRTGEFESAFSGPSFDINPISE
jgi:hypothetical protein